MDEDGNNEFLNVLQTETNELKQQLKLKDNEIKQFKQQINVLQDEVNNLQAVEDAHFFDETSKTSVPELHACVYSLRDFQVSCENVSNAINSVCKPFNKKPNKLPTYRSMNNWPVERSVIAREQMAEASNKTFTTLHTDEASKYGQK